MNSSRWRRTPRPPYGLYLGFSVTQMDSGNLHMELTTGFIASRRHSPRHTHARTQRPRTHVPDSSRSWATYPAQEPVTSVRDPNGEPSAASACLNRLGCPCPIEPTRARAHTPPGSILTFPTWTPTSRGQAHTRARPRPGPRPTKVCTHTRPRPRPNLRVRPPRDTAHRT